MLVALRYQPISRVNALHMTDVLTAAFGSNLLAANGITTFRPIVERRCRWPLPSASGILVSLAAILEYRGGRPVLARPQRRSGPFVSTSRTGGARRKSLSYPHHRV